jgi:hypothetical protein
MVYRKADPTEPPDLRELIRQVRRRWRAKLVLRGLALAAAGWSGLVLGAAYGLELLRFSPSAILLFRLLTLAALGLLLYRFVLSPLRRRVTDEQVALYLEEHAPSLQAMVVTAVEAADRPSFSPALVRRLIEEALERCRAVEFGRHIETRAARAAAIGLGAALVATMLFVALGPAYLRQGLAALLFVSRSLEAASPYRIEVVPGDATVPRGADQTITARLVGLAAEDVQLVVRKGPDGAVERLPMIAADGRRFYEGVLFDLSGPVQYHVEAAGVRSARYTLTVVELPYVERLELEYRFPPYTGLPPQKVPDGGDIAVLKGTEVIVRVRPTMPTPGGRLVLHDLQPLALKAEADGWWSTRFLVDRSGAYRVELQGPDGALTRASPQYTIDALADQPPVVAIAKPGRDSAAAPLDEVFVEARADDDYGVSQLELVYSVNGGPEQAVRLFGRGGRALAEVSAGHTFFLETLGVEPGDAVSYYARAQDNDQVTGPKRAVSDIYFLRVRPFRKDFKPAPSQAGAMGGGAGGQVGALSEQQRQIIAATFNVVRDRAQLGPDKLRENLVVIALSQARLREQVEGLVERMNSRLVEPDPAFKKIAEILPEAVKQMRAAEGKLQARQPEQALAPEQRALKFLQQAEEEYELQVAVSRAAGGGGGGPGSIAEDLADLFEMELDRLANQYEMAQRAEQVRADARLDELLERLRELARRQEQEAERRRRLARAGQSAAASGASQRALAEQVEEAARRLERLSRDEARPELADAARRLREAADAMRRAATGASGATAQAEAALERLREVEARLERGRQSRARREVDDARARAERLAREQREIADEVRRLGQAGAGRREQIDRLMSRKEALEQQVADLEQQLDRTAADIRRDEREAARKLQEAAAGIRDDRIKEKIRYGRGLLRSGASDFLGSLEDDVAANLDTVRRRLGEAAQALGRPSKEDTVAEMLDRARQIARGLESLDERLREQRAGRGELADRDAGARSGRRPEAPSGNTPQGSPRGGATAGRDAAGDRRAGSGDERPGVGDTVGPWGPGGGWGDRRPWAWTGDQIRQWRGEVRRWSSEVAELRGRLRQLGEQTADLDEILRALRALDAERIYHDAAELERLQSFVAEQFKRFEFDLRRRLDPSLQHPAAVAADEVPPEFRRLVEEYYRALARRRAR